MNAESPALPSSPHIEPVHPLGANLRPTVSHGQKDSTALLDCPPPPPTMLRPVDGGSRAALERQRREVHRRKRGSQMMTWRTRVMAMLGAICLMSAGTSISAAVLADTCSGEDATLLDLSCLGGCTTGACPSHSNGRGQDSSGRYAFCGCGSPVVEPACCHLIRRYTLTSTEPPEIVWGAYEVKGTCPPCPLSGGCLLKVVSGRNQAVCQ